MWQNYAAQCSGVVIGFRPSALRALPARVQRVQYYDEKTPSRFEDLAVSIAMLLSQGRSLEAMTAATTAVTALKHQSWAYEKEIRVIFNQRNDKPTGTDRLLWHSAEHEDGELVQWREPLTRITDGRSINYMAFPFGRRRNGRTDPSRAIETVIIGPKCLWTAIEIAAHLKGEGYSDFDIRTSECQIR